MSEGHAEGNGGPRWLWTAVALLALVVAGARVSWWAVRGADRRMREDLLAETRLLADAVGVDSVRLLAGDDSDLPSPAYLRLKEQIAILKKRDGRCRFIYLMGRKPDGRTFFYVDSEPAGTKDYSPPGQEYGEAQASDYRVFNERTGDVEGPVTGRWGTWVSARVPLVAPRAVPAGLATPSDASAMVRRAVDFYRKYGRERPLGAVRDPAGDFRSGELYAFVLDRRAAPLAYPPNLEKPGSRSSAPGELEGGPVARGAIRDLAGSRGRGWVEYRCEKQVSRRLDAKTTYVETVDDLVVCCGAYKGDGEVVAALGIDVQADSWRTAAARGAIPAAQLTVALAGILMGGRALAALRAQKQGRVLRHLDPGVAGLSCLVVTIFAALLAHRLESRNHFEAFRALAESRTGGVAEALRGLRDVALEGLAS